MSLAPKAQIGAYEVVELVGEGGMGQVYRAHDPRLGRDVAIKVLPSAFSTDADRLRRFEQEARAAAAAPSPPAPASRGSIDQARRSASLANEATTTTFAFRPTADGWP